MMKVLLVVLAISNVPVSVIISATCILILAVICGYWEVVERQEKAKYREVSITRKFKVLRVVDNLEEIFLVTTKEQGIKQIPKLSSEVQYVEKIEEMYLEMTEVTYWSVQKGWITEDELEDRPTEKTYKLYVVPEKIEYVFETN